MAIDLQIHQVPNDPSELDPNKRGDQLNIIRNEILPVLRMYDTCTLAQIVEHLPHYSTTELKFLKKFNSYVEYDIVKLVGESTTYTAIFQIHPHLREGKRHDD